MSRDFKGRRDEKKNLRAKARNASRRQWRRENPDRAGKQLKCWPLPS